MNTRLVLLPTILAAASVLAVTPVRHYHDSIDCVVDSTIIFDDSYADSSLLTSAIEVRASLPRATGQSPLEAFSVIWNVSPDRNNYYRATLRPVEPMPDDVFDCRSVMFTLDYHTAKGDSIITESSHRTDFGLERNENTLGVEIDYLTGHATIYGGEEIPIQLATIAMPSPVYPAMGLQADGKAKFNYIVTEYNPDALKQLTTGHTLQTLRSCLASAPAPEGFYQYLDCDTDNRFCRLGGNYTLALVKTLYGYDLIYINGAVTNSSKWVTGMRKATLKPTIFRSHYNLTWYDPAGIPLSDECSADIEQQAIIKLNFPLLKSSFRLSLIPQ